MHLSWLPLLALCAIGASAASKSVAHRDWNIPRANTLPLIDCAPDSGTAVVATADDLDSIRQCSNFKGNISIADGALTDVNLDGVQEITGDLFIADAGALTSVSSTTLETISTLSLKNLTNLAVIRFPALNNITTLHLETLPKLDECVIATGLMVRDVYAVIVLNVGLDNLNWLTWPVTRSMTIAANYKLTQWTVPFSRISSGSTYAISVNSALEDLNLSRLTTIDGSLEISNNLGRNLTFQNLESINGYMRLAGAFKNITMPALKEINGAIRAESTKDGDIIAFCDWLTTKPQMQGHFDCTGNATNPAPISQTSAPTTATPSPSVATNSDDQDSSPNTGLSTGAKVGIAVSVLLAAVISSAATFWFFRRYTKSKFQDMKEAEVAKRVSSSSNDYELDGGDARVEIGPALVRHELPEPEAREELEGEPVKAQGGGPTSEKERESRQKDAEVFELPA